MPSENHRPEICVMLCRPTSMTRPLADSGMLAWLSGPSMAALLPEPVLAFRAFSYKRCRECPTDDGSWSPDNSVGGAGALNIMNPHHDLPVRKCSTIAPRNRRGRRILNVRDSAEKNLHAITAS